MRLTFRAFASTSCGGGRRDQLYPADSREHGWSALSINVIDRLINLRGDTLSLSHMAACRRSSQPPTQLQPHYIRHSPSRCAESNPYWCCCLQAGHHRRNQVGTDGRVAVLRGINRGINYTTGYPPQRSMIWRKPWADTRDAIVQGVSGLRRRKRRFESCRGHTAGAPRLTSSRCVLPDVIGRCSCSTEPYCSGSL